MKVGGQMRMRVCACINCSSSPNKDACVCVHKLLHNAALTAAANTCSFVDCPEICTQKKIWCFFRLQNRLSRVTFGLFRNPAWDFPLLVFGLGRLDPAADMPVRQWAQWHDRPVPLRMALPCCSSARMTHCQVTFMIQNH